MRNYSSKFISTDKILEDFSWLDLIKTVWYFMSGQRIQFTFWTIVIIIVFFYQLLPGYFLGKMIDFFTNFKPGDSLEPFIIFVIGISLLAMFSAIIRLTAKRHLGDINAEARYAGRVKGFEKLIENSIAWHEEENTGNKVQKINSGMGALGQFMRIMNSDGFNILAGILGVIGFFIFQDIKYALFLIFYFIVFWLIQIAFNKRMKKIQDEINIANEKASGSYVEGLSNILTIKTLGAGDTFKNKINDAEKLARDLSNKSRVLGNTKWRVFNVFTSVCAGIYMIIVGHDIVTGFISVGTFIVYINYLNNLTARAGDSTDLIDQLIELKSAIGRMMPIFKENNSTNFGNKKFPRQWSKLSIKNAGFSYKTEQSGKFSIQDLTLEVNKGEKIGIVGRSGSGKSTLIKLLLGLYQLEKGDFKINNTNYYDLSHDEITKNISVVLQESELFNQSFKENITMMREFNIDLFARAINIAQLNDIIAKLPDGIESMIGEKGYRVSGGERQRIGIARAIYKDSGILIFDEATSNLDSKTEFNIQEALINKLKDQTMIIIAHRLSTLKNVDRIYVFENGKVIEEGKFEELINNKDSKFYELYEIQSRNQSI